MSSAQLRVRKLWVDFAAVVTRPHFLLGSPSEIICNPGLDHRDCADCCCHSRAWLHLHQDIWYARAPVRPQAVSPLQAIA